uniref:C2H2-type domain-containing protein n=1 Tax=viral metagenome TaxID=1070528 RepID=A0A6C0C5F2_9ZZZZ
MVKYSCEVCGKTFKQKGHYNNHINKKTPCKPIENKIIEDKINEKIQELSEKGDITINNINLNLNINELNINNMDNQPQEMDENIQNKEGMVFLSTIPDKSVNLILTDPPYITSTETGMGNLHKQIQENEKNGVECMKTEDEWNTVKDKYIGKKMPENKMKENFIKYGNIYGKKYSVQTEYGDWDKNFTMEMLDKFIGEYYKKLVPGGTVIIFFDIWKITPLKGLLEKHKFKQIRFIEWIKTNPQPLNQKVNYLTNCREIALLGVKGGKPTFNSKYDNAIYEQDNDNCDEQDNDNCDEQGNDNCDEQDNDNCDEEGELYKYPIQSGKKRFHPTQKSLPLFEALIKKHSNEGDTVLDTFLGSGTTAVACKNTDRICKGCEVSKEYYDKMIALL